MKKEYLEPSVQVHELNIADGILAATSGMPVTPDKEGEAASRMDSGDGIGSSSKSTDLWNEGW
jgi:hypothetical protein